MALATAVAMTEGVVVAAGTEWRLATYLYDSKIRYYGFFFSLKSLVFSYFYWDIYKKEKVFVLVKDVRTVYALIFSILNFLGCIISV
jgi:hypothetical protein